MYNKQTECRYKKYDEVVTTIMKNVIVERQRNNRFILFNFNTKSNTDRLYFNVALIAAILGKEKIYLDMPLLSYIKFWIKRRKKCRNLQWLNFFQKKKIAEENKTSVSTIMNFVAEQLNVDDSYFKAINDEYYGWID